MVSTADEMVQMTSAALCFEVGFGSKMEEKAAEDDSSGTGVVTDIGLCKEKKFDKWTSGPLLARRLSSTKDGKLYHGHASGSSEVRLAN